jgi:hypothetical protein
MITRRIHLFSLLLLPALLLLQAGCANRLPPPEPVTIPQIVEMSKAGTPPADIIARMRESGTVYRLQASQYIELANQGVAPDIMDYMQQTYLLAVREDAEYDNWNRWTPYGNYWYGGAPYGWPAERVIVVREQPPPPPPPPAKPPRRKK